MSENPWLKLGQTTSERVGEEPEPQPNAPAPSAVQTAPANPWVGLTRVAEAQSAAEEADSEVEKEAVLEEPDAAQQAAEDGLPDPDIAFRSRPVGGAGYLPQGLRRRERRSRNKAAQQREGAWRRVLMRERKAAMEAEKQSRKDASYLPATGEKKQEAGRSFWRLTVEPHRATSDTLSVGYPYLAEAGLGSDGELIGHDSWSGAAFCFDIWTSICA